MNRTFLLQRKFREGEKLLKIDGRMETVMIKFPLLVCHPFVDSASLSAIWKLWKMQSSESSSPSSLFLPKVAESSRKLRQKALLSCPEYNAITNTKLGSSLEQVVETFWHFFVCKEKSRLLLGASSRMLIKPIYTFFITTVHVRKPWVIAYLNGTKASDVCMMLQYGYCRQMELLV